MFNFTTIENAGQSCNPLLCAFTTSFGKAFYKAFLFLVLIGLSPVADINAQTGAPCNAQRWTKGGSWSASCAVNDANNAPSPKGVIRCGNAADTQSGVNTNTTYNPGVFTITPNNCLDPDDLSPVTITPPFSGQKISWFNFDVRAGAPSFFFQCIATGNYEMEWALYYSMNPTCGTGGNGLSGDCTAMSGLLSCGTDFNGWSPQPYLTPDINQPTNLYLVVWKKGATNSSNDDFNFNFKARFGCGAAPVTLTATCPGDLSLGACLTQAEVDAAFADWLDDFGYVGCNTATESGLNVNPPSSCGGSVTVNYAVSGCNQTDGCSATFSVVDNANPAIVTAAADETVECGAGNNAALTAWLNSHGGASATDDCPGVTWSNNFTSLSDLCGATGAATVIFTATDACNNATTTTATFTIEDTKAPTLTGTLPGGANLNLCFSAAPSAPTEASIAALYSDDCSGVTATLLSSDVTGDDCSWSATYTYGIKDDCDNAAADAVVTYTGGDNQGPTCPTPPASFGMMACINSIPCPTVALAWMQANISDNCTSASSITLSQTGDTGLATCSNGVFSRTYTYLATDACDNTTTCSVTYSGVCQTLCTFTQGGWGQAGGAPGTVFGTTDLVLIGNLIAANGGVLQIGTPTNGRYLNIFSASCVQTLLPGGGPAAALKVSGGSGCFFNQPSKNGKLNNVLASQTIALTLNTWLSGSMYQPGKNLGAESLDCIPGIPADVLAKLGANKTVGGLLELTNKFLGGENTSPVGASSLNTAVTIINERWGDCVQPIATCSDAAPMMLAIGNLGNPTFHAWKLDHKVNLRWFVRNSEEVDHFVVKRSTDLIDYQKVATIMSGIDNNVESYLALDEHPAKGFNYYQLTIFMKNGEVETLPEVEVFIPNSKPYQLLPNPAKYESWINMTLLNNEKDVTIVVTNCVGQAVLVQRIEEVKDDFFRLDLNNLRDGMYFVSVKVGREIFTDKLIITNTDR